MSAGRDAPELTRLGKYMDHRAGELGLTWIDIARISGVDRETLRKLRYGLMGKRGAAPRTKHAVEQALHWASGSIDAVDAAGAPTPLAPSGHTAAPAGQASSPTQPRRPGGASPEDVLNHLEAALQLGGPEYFWQAMIQMNRLHNPQWVEPIPPQDADRSA